MNRISLALAAIGGTAVLSVTGVALGSAAADRTAQRSADTALVATTSTPDTTTPAAPATDGNPAPGLTATTRAATDPGTPPASQDTISRERAGEIALAAAGGGRIVEVDREREHNRPVWSIEIINGTTEYEIDVDRETGTILDTEKEPVDDDNDDDDDRDDDRDDKDDRDDDDDDDRDDDDRD
ncbi:hypothetical protein AWW66_06870 [Micromonospora rosaria]|uniref:PepSY domain-containing protein n=1 Tax=Micromonospora rosaria TaxID=47874 RepID=A0A136PWB5_9ACTN|nr:PepSY domain-containing protein [Micromonospora rosaria]KXK62779.1 hypothetical protein AWW66_06870 [Micromonospora rosaria]